jgi:hypothetical protein
MAHSHDKPSPEARTYTPQDKIEGPTMTCSRCGRIHKYPRSGDPPIRCECGWWYSTVDGTLVEEFKSRLGV